MVVPVAGALVFAAIAPHGGLAIAEACTPEELGLAKQYDELICDLVRGEGLDRLSDVPPELVETAKADSWWQRLMLHGATGKGWNGRLVSYEAPTYFGMLTAAYEPTVNRGTASPPRKRSARRTRAR
jgi:hypothetical protein